MGKAARRKRELRLGEAGEAIDLTQSFPDESPGASVAKPIPAGSPILHHQVTEQGESMYINEGFTPDQLSDPRTIEYLMDRIKADRPTPDIPMTIPYNPVIKTWVGARTYKKACSAVYGECPRSDDRFKPLPSMMMAQNILEPILKAHPIILEPAQMNSIDDEDWSFAEACDYAQMAHLPFEPVYLDFGGHEAVYVDLEYGKCQLHGAVIWRSGHFNTPTLAVAPIGGFDYLTGPFTSAMIEAGVPEDKVLKYVGSRPLHMGDIAVYGSDQQIAQAGPLYRISGKEFDQWQFQAGGICWFGLKSGDSTHIKVVDQTIKQEKIGINQIPMVYSTEKGIAAALKEDEERIKAIILTGITDVVPPGEYTTQADVDKDQELMIRGATEMVAKLSERALLGLYFLENAPVHLDQVPLSRPERREQERKAYKRGSKDEIASIVVIQSNRSSGGRSEVPMAREHSHRWERRGYFAHYHENNRHYQNRPDLVKPCHRCERAYALNKKARREGRELPFPNVESPDCIKNWIEPTICGPEGAPLKKKVRIRKKDIQEVAS